MDAENAIKTEQTANLLCSDLQELAKSADPIIGMAAMELLEEAAALEKKAKRLSAAIQRR